MKITLDTNVLVRVLVADGEAQAAAARTALLGATRIAVPVTALCELVWVLRARYGYSVGETILAVETLVAAEAVVTDAAAVEAGLAMLRAGADFADGVIAHTGAALGGATFLSFDRAALAAWRGAGGDAAEPGA